MSNTENPSTGPSPSDPSEDWVEIQDTGPERNLRVERPSPFDTIRENTLHIIEGVGTLIPGADTQHADDCPGCKTQAALTEVEQQLAACAKSWKHESDKRVAAETALAKHRETSTATIRKMGDALDRAQQKVRDQESRFTNPYRSDLDRAVAVETALAEAKEAHRIVWGKWEAAERRANEALQYAEKCVDEAEATERRIDALADALRRIAAAVEAWDNDETPDEDFPFAADMDFVNFCGHVARAALNRQEQR